MIAPEIKVEEASRKALTLNHSHISVALAIYRHSIFFSFLIPHPCIKFESSSLENAPI